jgi:hypothetical protein
LVDLSITKLGQAGKIPHLLSAVPGFLPSLFLLFFDFLAFSLRELPGIPLVGAVIDEVNAIRGGIGGIVRHNNSSFML